MNLFIRVCDTCFEIESEYEISGLGSYESNPEDFAQKIVVTREDIEAEKNTSGNVASDRFYASSAVLRKVARYCLENHRMLIHGVCIEFKNQGVLFCAPSGTGKSTHASLWEKYEGTKIVNGDKPILQFCEDKILAYGTPWCGKEGQNINKSVPLKAIVFIKQSTQNKIKRISGADAFVGLYGQCNMNGISKEENSRIIENIRRLMAQIPVFELSCDISRDAFLCCKKEIERVI